MVIVKYDGQETIPFIGQTAHEFLIVKVCWEENSFCYNNSNINRIGGFTSGFDESLVACKPDQPWNIERMLIKTETRDESFL